MIDIKIGDILKLKLSKVEIVEVKVVSSARFFGELNYFLKFVNKDIGFFMTPKEIQKCIITLPNYEQLTIYEV